MHRYLGVIEKADGTYSAYSPDLGCVATGATREEAEERMREAIAFHLDGLPARTAFPSPIRRPPPRTSRCERRCSGAVPGDGLFSVFDSSTPVRACHDDAETSPKCYCGMSNAQIAI